MASVKYCQKKKKKKERNEGRKRNELNHIHPTSWTAFFLPMSGFPSPWGFAFGDSY